MKKVYLSLLFSSLLFGEGLNTSSMLDPSKIPNFSSCSDIANIAKNKPVLLPTYTQVLAETGSPGFSIKGPVEIDVKVGTVSYRVFNSLTSDIADKPSFINNLCTTVDPDVMKQGISQETQSIHDDVQKMYDAADSIYDQAQKESEQKSDGKTQSDVLGQALAGNVDAAQDAEKKVNNYNPSNGPTARVGMTSPHLGFMSKINTVNNELQTLIFLGVVLMTMLGLGAGYITKKLQKRSDHEDYLSRFGLGVIMTFLLFSNANTYKYGSGEISQTRMQSIWGWMLNKGTAEANFLAGAAHQQQMKYTIDKFGGKEIEKQVTQAVQEKLALENQQGAYEGILHQCLQSYKVNDLMMTIGDKKSGGKRYFPTDEASVQIGEENVYSRYLQPTVNQEDVYMSLPTCGKAEQEYRTLVSKKQELQEKIDSAKDTQLQERYTVSSKQIIADSTKAGWIGIAMLPVHHFVTNGVGQKIKNKASPVAKKEVEETKECPEGEWTMSNTFEKLGCYVEKISDYVIPMKSVYDKISAVSLDDYMQAVAQRSALMVVPGVPTVFEVIYKMINGIPIPGSGFFGSIVAFYASSELGMSVIQNLPFLVLIPAISIVIAMYYAEVFLYSITIPYVAAYAFSRDQWGHLVKHAVRGIMIALKPAMIVVSVYTALYVSDVVSNISSNMIQKQTAILMADNEAKHQTVSIMDSIKNSVNLINENAATGPNIYENGSIAFGGFMGKFTIYMIQGFLFIIMAVVQVFIVIKIIISGPAMIMEMFGVRETDMASQMTESVASNAKKYEGGI